MNDPAPKRCPFCGAKFASPGPSELVDEMEKLEAEMRDMASKVGPRVLAQVHPNWVADRLIALITRHRGGVVKNKTGIELITAERNRQLRVERWSAKHDNHHVQGELAHAAISYAFAESSDSPMPKTWPWERFWWKPKDRVRNLVRAGALIAAEIDRLNRIKEQEP